jgi:hypothetical protein
MDSNLGSFPTSVLLAEGGTFSLRELDELVSASLVRELTPAEELSAEAWDLFIATARRLLDDLSLQRQRDYSKRLESLYSQMGAAQMIAKRVVGRG